MAIAVVAVASASAHYLGAWPPLEKASLPRPGVTHQVLKPGWIASYRFTDASRGWALLQPDASANPFRVFSTADAGAHWTSQLFGDGWTASSFVDGRIGFVVAGRPRVLLRTDDGGAHWSRLDPHWSREGGGGARLNLELMGLSSIQFIDASTGWMVASDSYPPSGNNPALYVSHDGGNTWSRLPNEFSARWFMPVFRDRYEGWGAPAGQIATPVVWRTTDGGRTWEDRVLAMAGRVTVDVAPRGGPAIVSMFSGSTNPVAVYSATDLDFSTWHQFSPLKGGGVFRGMRYFDALRGWAVQGSNLYKTEDAGRSWSRFGAVPSGLRLIEVMDSSHAWAQLDFSSGTSLVHTADGGRQWTSTSLPRP